MNNSPDKKKPVEILPIEIPKGVEISTYQLMAIADVLKESGADSNSQLVAMAKITKILKNLGI